MRTILLIAGALIGLLISYLVSVWSGLWIVYLFLIPVGTALGVRIAFALIPKKTS